jgi:two-component sensor histidine kinase
MAEDGLLTDRPVVFGVHGDPGELPAEVATPLAVVLTELLQNAAEHAFPDDGTQKGQVIVDMKNDGTSLTVVVSDNGAGLPSGFDIDRTSSLGLSIVRDLVQSQLSGRIEMKSDEGTTVRLVIPVSR